MKLLICGSRKIARMSLLHECLDVFPHTGIVGTIISGGAKGVDKLAIDYAKEYGIKPVEIEADWYPNGSYDPGAGYKRNRIMLDLLNQDDVVLALWDGKSSGTKDMINISKKKGIEVWVFTVRTDKPITLSWDVFNQNKQLSLI